LGLLAERTPVLASHALTLQGSTGEALRFYELCFLCNEWFMGEDVWEAHCQEHIHDLELFPAFLDPLIFDGVLAMAGFCWDCITNPRLPASKRMHQFKVNAKWQTNVQGYIDGLNDCKPVGC
jgi:hypothetical protein